MGRRLTPSAIDAATAKPQPYFLVDSETGLSLRISPRGVKTFRLRLRSQNLPPGKKKSRVISLGRWSMQPARGCVTLGEARQWCDRLHLALKEGPDAFTKVAAELTALLAPLPAAATSPTGRTVSDVAKDFLAVIDKQRKRPDIAHSVLEKDILPTIGSMPLAALKKSDCIRVVREVVARPAPVHAAKVLALLKQLLDFAETMEDAFTNPAARLKAGHLGVEHNVGDRWLDEKEVAALWRVLETAETARVGGQLVGERRTRIAFELLLLTAARGGELRQARWEFVDLEASTWTIPVTHQKLSLKQAQKARPFTIPLSPTALTLFQELRDIDRETPWLFPGAGAGEDQPLAPYSEKALGRAFRRMWTSHPELKKLEPASPHDLRRTARTWLGKLGVAPHIAERCLNHSVGRIETTYDHHDYLAERRAALNLWDATIQKWVTPPGDGV